MGLWFPNVERRAAVWFCSLYTELPQRMSTFKSLNHSVASFACKITWQILQEGCLDSLGFEAEAGLHLLWVLNNSEAVSYVRKLLDSKGSSMKQQCLCVVSSERKGYFCRGKKCKRTSWLCHLWPLTASLTCRASAVADGADWSTLPDPAPTRQEVQC